MIAVMIIWSTFYPIIKYIVMGVDPLVMSFYRYFLGFIPMTPFFIMELRKNRTAPSVEDTVKIGLLGFIGITLFSAGLFYGIKLSTAVNGSLLTNTQPIFTALLGPMLISEAVSRRKAAGILIGVAGMVLVVTGGNPENIRIGGTAFAGNLLLAGASLSLSLYSILIKRFVKKYGSIIPTWISMVSGTVFIMIINLIRKQNIIQVLELPVLSIGMILYLGIIGTSITYLVFNRALAHMSVISAVSYKLLIPVFSLILSYFFIGERPCATTMAGTAVVFLSIYLIQKSTGETGQTAGKSSGEG